MKKILLSIVTLLSLTGIFAQNVGVGTNSPHASAKLDIQATNMGILIPQVDLNTTVFPAPGPATGLLIWNSNAAYGNGIGFYYNFGTSASPAWLRMADMGAVDDAGEFKSIGGLVQNTTDIANDDFVFGSTSLDSIAGSDDDMRVFFDKSKGAFRAGEASTSAWDDANVGNNSIATGKETIASGEGATAMGNETTASGENGVAIGLGTIASAFNSVAMGLNSEASAFEAIATGRSTRARGEASTATGAFTDASGEASTALGYETSAYGQRSTAMGDRSAATNYASTAIGSATLASGQVSTAMGSGTEASGNNSTAMGFESIASGSVSTTMGDSTVASGEYSTAMGINTSAPSFGETSLGLYSETYTPLSATTYNSTDRLFVVGNGTSSAARSNALTVFKNGTTRLSSLGGTGTRMVVADADGDLSTQTIPANGDITDVTAGDGLIGGGSSGAVTLNVVATNGLTDNANDVRLGGDLIEETTINQGVNNLNFNLNSTGDFNVQDNGTTRFQVLDDGRIEMSGTTDAGEAANTGVLEISNSLRIDGNEVITNTDSPLYLQNDNNGDLIIDGSTLVVDASENRVGVGTTAPSHNLQVYGDAPFLTITNTTETDAGIIFNDQQALTTQFFDVKFNSSNNDLTFNSDDNSGTEVMRLFHEGDVSMPSGWLSVGGTSTSTTRSGVYEFTWQGNIAFDDDGYRYFTIGSFAYPTVDLPSSVTVTKIIWEMDGYHTDANEDHGVWIKFGTGTAGPWYGWIGNSTNGPKDVNWHYVSDALSASQTRNTTISMRVEDEDCVLCGGDEMRVFNMHVKIYYEYTQALQDGDIAASGRIYANSTTDVGDLAEYFEVNGAYNIGDVVVLNPQKDNDYSAAENPYSQFMVGVVSKNPSIVLNNPEVGPPVALAGRVNVNLVKNQELIEAGDFLTSSQEAGKAMLATQAGPVIGYAVTNQKEGEDFVQILVQPGRFYFPTPYQNYEADDYTEPKHESAGEHSFRRN